MTRLDGFVEKGWGHELIWATNDKYCGKLLRFNKDAKFSMHFHAEKDETWYVLDGKFIVKWIDTKDASQHEAELNPGNTVRNFPFLPHQIICIEEGTIIEVSTPDSVEDNYRVLPGDSQKTVRKTIEHFYDSIEGWFSYPYIYDNAVSQAQDGALFVEVGSFKGRSSAYLATQIINSGKNIRLDCVDTWLGSTEHQQGGDCEVKEVVEGTLFETFVNNMKPVEGHYRAVQLTSLEAAAQYEDNSIDFIMIDGEHSFEAVTNDIRAFLPKMKNGGIMTGDDSQEWNPVRQAAINELSKYNVIFPTGGHFYAVIQ